MRTRFDTPRTVLDTVDRKIHVVARNLHLTRRLIPTVCVSPPRSGHHLLTNYLFKYFGGDPTFPDLAGHETRRRGKRVIVAGPLHYCEYYHHCRRFPWVDPLVNMMKFHDRAGGRPDSQSECDAFTRDTIHSVRPAKQPGLWADTRVSALEEQVIPLLERVGIGPLLTGVHAT